MREKEVRKVQGEAFALRMPRNAKTRPTHICVIEQAAHMFSSSLHADLRKWHLLHQSSQQVCELYR